MDIQGKDKRVRYETNDIDEVNKMIRDGMIRDGWKLEDVESSIKTGTTFVLVPEKREG